MLQPVQSTNSVSNPYIWYTVLLLHCFCALSLNHNCEFFLELSPSSAVRGALHPTRNKHDIVLTSTPLIITTRHLVQVFPLVPNGYTRLLSRGQGYNIDLSLVMPESEANARTGMFMATLALGSSRDAATHAATSSRPGAWCVGDSCGGSVTHSAGGAATAVSRPAVLRHRSWLLYAARTTVLAIPLLVGFVDEAQTLDVELFRNTKDNETHPYTWAAVVLSGRELEVWSAELRFHVHFTGATYVLRAVDIMIVAS